MGHQGGFTPAVAGGQLRSTGIPRVSPLDEGPGHGLFVVRAQQAIQSVRLFYKREQIVPRSTPDQKEINHAKYLITPVISYLRRSSAFSGMLFASRFQEKALIFRKWRNQGKWAA